MKIFSEDISGIEKELDDLVKEVHHSHNLAEKRCILVTLEALTYFYTIMGYDGMKYLKEVYSNKSFIRPITEKNGTIKNRINNDFIQNKYYYLDLLDNIFNDDVDIELGYNPNSHAPDIDEAEMYEILSDYFKSTEKQEALDNFKYMSNNGRIQSIYLSDNSPRGLTFLNLLTNEDRIFINRADGNPIRTMIALAHEMGHVVDYAEIKDLKSKVYYNFESLFIEVLSSLYEKEFMDFLIKNNIYKYQVLNCLGEFYEQLFSLAADSSVYHTIPNKFLKHNRYMKLTKEKLIEEISKEHEVLVESDEFPEPQDLDFLENLEYGYGITLGTYFSRLKIEDKKKYQEEMSKFLSLRTDYFDKSYLEKMGTNTKKVVELVDRDINLSSAKVKVKRR